MSEKTHEPSDQKLREARKKGQIPRSKLFTSAAVTLGGLGGTLAFSNETVHRLTGWTVGLLSLRETTPSQALLDAVTQLALALAPTLVGALGAALLATVAITGLQVNTDLVMPNFERLDFIEGSKKLFSIKQLIEVAKGLALAALLGWVLFGAVSALGPLAFKALTFDGASALPALLTLWKPVVLKTSVLLLVLGVADQALAHRRHRKDLMMSHDEVKQEHKNSEGDPHAKAKRKSMHKQLASGGPARGVQKATAVVVNPTHIAVALRYDEGECDAPYIVAKGQEEDALKIRKQAESQGIPVIRDIPLARSLVHFDVGEQVPEELYQAAAAVLKVALEATQQSAETDPVRAGRRS